MRTHVHRAAALAAVAFLAAAFTSAPSGAEPLPNLVPAAPANLHLGVGDGGRGEAFRFDTTTWNVGAHHLDLTGVPAGPQEAIALQCTVWAPTPRTCLSREEVGRFVFHDVHAHYHFDEYAAYALRTLGDDGAPDLTDAGLIATGTKASFCLMDTDRAASGSQDPFFFGFYSFSCLANHQGISAGWGDTYTYHLVGQQVLVPEDLEPGVYAVVVHVNPEGVLRETDHEDNVAWTTFTWSGYGIDDVRMHDRAPSDGLRVHEVRPGPSGAAVVTTPA